MTLAYKLVGYDRQTELLAVEHEIPAGAAERAKAIAGIWAKPEIIGDWPLSYEQAAQIAALVRVPVAPARDWFLEPYEVEHRQRA